MPRTRTPMRENAFRIVAFAAGPLIALIVGLVVLGSSGGLESIPLPFLVLAVAIFLLVSGGAIAVGVLLGRKMVGDRIELAFREGGGRWRHGRITLEDGRATLQPYWWQVRIPAGDPMPLDIRELGEDTGRTPPPRRWWSLNPQLRIVDMQTDRGAFEIAALPSHLAEFRERLSEV